MRPLRLDGILLLFIAPILVSILVNDGTHVEALWITHHVVWPLGTRVHAVLPDSWLHHTWTLHTGLQRCHPIRSLLQICVRRDGLRRAEAMLNLGLRGKYTWKRLARDR